MKPLLQIAWICLLGSVIAAPISRAASLVQVDPYVNLETTFEWNGTWTTTAGSPEESQVLGHAPGWWNMTLTTVKTIEQGKERYRMTFSGAHNDGPTVTHPLGSFDALPVGTFNKSLSHGDAQDVWKIVVGPVEATPGVISWSVTAQHVGVPEPGQVAMAAGAGLLVFAVARIRRRRTPSL